MRTLRHLRDALFNLPIGAKFTAAYGVLIFTFVGALSIFSYTASVRIFQEESVRSARGIVEQIRNNVDAALNDINLVSYIIFSNPEVLKALKYQESLATLDSWQRYTLQSLMSDVKFSRGMYRGDISSISIYQNNGSRLALDPLPLEIPFEMMSSVADAGDGQMMWLPTDGSLEVIPMVRKVRDLEMKPVGYLRIDIKASALREKLSTELSRAGGAMFVVDGEVLILSAGDRDPRLPNLADMLPLLVGEDGSFLFGDGRDRHLVVHFASRTTPWRYIASIPMRRITQPVGAIRTLTLIGSTVTIILFFLASLAIVRQFTNPIRQIASQMRIARIGDWQPDLRVDGTDEIAYLSRQFVAMMERLQKLAAELVEEKTRLYRQEMEALQAQINPHFLFNTLDVVNWMASEHEVPPIAAIVRALSGMMRYALGRSGAPATLGAEMDYLTDYLHIQSVRFADRFSACVSVPDDLRGCAVPRLIVQPIVENAIRHGFRGLKRPGTITISATCHAGDLSITVADDGNGMSPETIARITGIEDPAAGERAGIGARNVDRRLKLAFGPGYGLRYRSVPGGGTSCTITLPDAGRVTCGR